MADEDDLHIGPCLMLASKTGGVRLMIGGYTRFLSLDEADAAVLILKRAVQDARATQELVRAQPDGLARMGGFLFAQA